MEISLPGQAQRRRTACFKCLGARSPLIRWEPQEGSGCPTRRRCVWGFCEEMHLDFTSKDPTRKTDVWGTHHYTSEKQIPRCARNDRLFFVGIRGHSSVASAIASSPALP